LHFSHASDVQRIFIRTANWIGDAVMSTPAIGAVRRQFPRAEIVVASNPTVTELFRFHPYCDRTLVFDKKGADSGAAGLFLFSRRLRREGFDLAILLQNAVEAAIMARLAGIPYLMGYRSDGRGLLLTHGVPVGPEEKRLHHTDYCLRMLEHFDISAPPVGLKLSCTPEELSWAHSLLGEIPWVAINPGAAYGSAKQWFPERFAAVADALVRDFGIRILLSGGPEEVRIGRDIERAMSSRPLNLIGKTTVRQLMALLASCRLVVTNDSGPMHIAAAFNVPVVAVFGPTDPSVTAPRCERAVVVRHQSDCAPCRLRLCPSDHQCMEGVRPDEVLAAAVDLLRRKQ
jgi:heptosyltransferase II